MAVKVSFFVEESDPADPTGVTEDDYMDILDHIMQVGGSSATFEKVA